MYQHDARNTGQGESGPVLGAEVAWSTVLGGTDFGQPLSSPVVSDGQLFVSQLTDETNRIVALDVETGTERWTHSVAGSAGLKPGTPAVENGVVYAGFGGTIAALNTADGTEQWRFEEATIGALNGIVIRDNTLYTTDQQQIYAVDASTGALEWSFQPPTNATGPVTIDREVLGTNLAVTGGTVYYNTLVFRTDTEAGTRERFEGVAALDIASQEEQWVFESFEGEYDSLDAKVIDVDQSSPAVSDGTVYCGLPQGELCALDAATGTPEWRTETESPTRFSPAVDEDSVYIHYAGSLCAYDRTTGAELWCADTARVSPVVTDEAVYTQNSAHDRDTGERLWELDRRQQRGSPALVGGRLYCKLGPSGEEGIYALAESQGDGGGSDDPGDDSTGDDVGGGDDSTGDDGTGDDGSTGDDGTGDGGGSPDDVSGESGDSTGSDGRSDESSRPPDDTGGGFSVDPGSSILGLLLAAILAVGSYVYYRLRRSGDQREESKTN